MDNPNFGSSSSNIPPHCSTPLTTSTGSPVSQPVSFAHFDSLTPLQSLSPFDINIEDDIELNPSVGSNSASSASEFQMGGLWPNFGSSTSGSEEAEDSGIPQPLEYLLGNPIPPFLSKTYDLVGEPSLDAIISWGAAGKSFVVWDPVEFARTILPRNFKHNNFSSFVRQLNTYGFRKIDTDKWEFANEAFMRGERHLLKNIRRRRSSQSSLQACGAHQPHKSPPFRLETELEKLKEEKSHLMQEVVELQQRDRETFKRAETVQQRIQASEQRQKQMVSFLAKVFKNPEFIGRLQQLKEQRKTLDQPKRARRRLVEENPKEQGFKDVGGSSTFLGEQIVSCRVDWLNPDSCELTPGRSTTPTDHLPQDLVGKWPTEFSYAAEVHPSVIKGKGVAPDQLDVEGVEEYFVYFPEHLAKESLLPEFPALQTEQLVIEDPRLNTGLDYDYSMDITTPAGEFWGNVDVASSVSSGLLDVWDLGVHQDPGLEKPEFNDYGWKDGDDNLY